MVLIFWRDDVPERMHFARDGRQFVRLTFTAAPPLPSFLPMGPKQTGCRRQRVRRGGGLLGMSSVLQQGSSRRHNTIICGLRVARG
jgi:hypothetical protein